jgi:sulfatase modifying factor 1
LVVAVVAGWWVAARWQPWRSHDVRASTEPSKPVVIQAPAVAPANMTTFTNTLGIKFVRIEPGEFTMGSPANEMGRNDNETQHRVRLTKPFSMAVHLVTRGQFASFVKDTSYRTEAEAQKWALVLSADGTKGDVDRNAWWGKPDFDQTDDHPVIEVSRNDTMQFCRWLSRKEGGNYRLPTEAEWEYACRAGTHSAYFWGENPDGGGGYANCADLTASAKYPKWPAFNWRDGFVFTSPVGSFKPNPWGLYDMIGNVREWCGDAFGPYGTADVVDPVGPVPRDGAAFVLRGGSWLRGPIECRSAFRSKDVPFNRGDDIGFRLCMDSPSR